MSQSMSLRVYPSSWFITTNFSTIFATYSSLHYDVWAIEQHFVLSDHMSTTSWWVLKHLEWMIRMTYMNVSITGTKMTQNILEEGEVKLTKCKYLFTNILPMSEVTIQWLTDQVYKSYLVSTQKVQFQNIKYLQWFKLLLLTIYYPPCSCFIQFYSSLCGDNIVPNLILGISNTYLHLISRRGWRVGEYM